MILLNLCLQAYYGGEARCDVEMAENFNPEELVCGGCSDIAKAQVRCIQRQTSSMLQFMFYFRCAQNMEWTSLSINVAIAVPWPCFSALGRLISVTLATMISSD